LFYGNSHPYFIDTDTYIVIMYLRTRFR